MYWPAERTAAGPGLWMVGTVLMATAGLTQAEESSYRFDDRLLIGSGLAGGSLERFNRANQVDPGTYLVDVYANDVYVGRSEVEFRASADGVAPCLGEAYLQQTLQVRPPDRARAGETGDGCQALAARLPGVQFTFDAARLRLDLWLPQALLNRASHDHVDADRWDPGETMAFANYDLNASHSSVSGGAGSDYASLGINAGLNLGLWRVRHQSNATYSRSQGHTSDEWNSIRTYAERPIARWRSTLAIGNQTTEGNLFGSIGYLGARLASDDRMIPDSQRNYAPRVQGMAPGKSRVVISQNGRKLQETMVAPGPFVIDDIYGASYGGDLEVQVIGVDGSVSSFAVPFSAVPESVRPGYSRYSATVGEALAYGDARRAFAELTYQRGVSNLLTANLGARVAEDYQGLLVGGVVATRYGAFGSNAIFSRVAQDAASPLQGYRLELNYSKTFQATDTTVTLAGYRYSSQGYRDLADVVGPAGIAVPGEAATGGTRNQRNQFHVLANQRLGNYGSLYVAGSAADYFDGGQRDAQFQLGYSNTWRRLSYSLSMSRQRDCAGMQQGPAFAPSLPAEHGRVERCPGRNTLGLSVSLPLGVSPRAPVASAVASSTPGNRGGDRYQSVLSGTLGEARATSYSIAGGAGGAGEGGQWSGSVQTQTPVASLSAGIAGSADYRQANVGMRGAVVVHREGVTLGPYVGDTFALLKAEGAAGSSVRGGQGARVNRNGFALVPSLSPYRNNAIGLDPQGIAADAELVETERKVAPYAGAAVRVEFKTLGGRPMVIRATRADGVPIPLGASVLDEQGVAIGMVGQAGQVYARAPASRGLLQVTWGRGADESCRLPYAMDGADAAGHGLVILQGTCVGITDEHGEPR
ncbi:fimbria/pilus outer membrane usher protein [Stenotrophomonas sp. PD6]|uniref:fimbria/pilus outer membrane usher protein n=1 Tax=Stenotrophomonas sp. PD6 TaxID=3368612 RepID=UPI003BA08B76